MSNSSTPRELNWHQMVAYALLSEPASALRHPELQRIANNYHRNIGRIRSMILLPSAVGRFSRQIQRCYDLAELSLTKKLENTGRFHKHPRHSEFAQQAVNLYHAVEDERREILARSNAAELWREEINEGTVTVLALAAPENAAHSGLEAMISSSILACWTAFETMAGDLWESALNIHPAGLAELKGKRKRMLSSKDDESVPAPVDGQDDTETLRTIPLAQVLRHQFDIKEKMGTVLRTRIRFDHLAGIREAYSLAFHKNFDGVQKALVDESIDALNAVRNLIVHRNGIVDATYDKKAKYLKLPKADLGHPITLEARSVVVDLLVPPTLRSCDLLKAVDDWVSAN